MSQNPRSLLKKHGLHPKKPWGQNFLVDPSMVERIVDELGVTSEDTVVEFGAGTGALTFPLSDRAGKVFAVERDRDLVALLENELDADNVEVIAADAAKFSFDSVTPSEGLYVIGNLPYNITAPILFHLHENRDRFKRAILMVQKEVADRLSAQPEDGKDYSILSILFGAFFYVEQAIFVPRKYFFPKPRVDSVIILLEPLAQPAAPIDDEARFQQTVKIAFAQRRKTLMNNLKAGFKDLSKEQLQAILDELGLDAQQRGETLTIPQFAALSNKLGEALQAQEDLRS